MSLKTVQKKISQSFRKTPPPIFEVTSLELPHPSVAKLDNGIPVYQTRLGTQEIMKIDVTVLSGRSQETKKMTMRATSRLLREGTASYNSAEIAHQLDFWAGTLKMPINMDTSNVTLYCMTKHFPKLLPLLAEIIQQPTFPQKELTTFVENNIQNLAVELTKNDVIAYRTITEMAFGAESPYGYSSIPDDYRALTTEDLQIFHRNHYTSDNMVIFLSGNFDDSILTLLNQYLGQNKSTAIKQNRPLSMDNVKPEKIRVKNPDTLQAAIRIGRRMGNRKDPDYDGFFVLNTILGGYFGSRLMSNIREDKGYTYNINSMTDTMFGESFFYIGSEIGNEFVEKALVEVYREMDILQNDLVGDDELTMVRNYLLGNMLTMVDGPFAVNDVIRTYVLEDMPFDSFTQFVDNIRSVTPTILRDLAQKYLNKEDMFEVIVGDF
ncbi:MAG: insulinase family protein [Saprospiraceae bacterium]|nr:insulinase family protein [Saprospiraceae bacterium]